MPLIYLDMTYTETSNKLILANNNSQYNSIENISPSPPGNKNGRVQLMGLFVCVWTRGRDVGEQEEKATNPGSQVIRLERHLRLSSRL